ncbi:MAG TPA: twin-arginine translocase TatA/TatE family subunit [Solirubrobacteraceae bacterium]|jgi:sec-independent protein translocase protein TatA
MGLDNPLHILLLLLVVVLVFGAKRLPEIGRSLGDGMRGFKDSLNGGVHHAVSLDAAAAIPTAAPIAMQVAVPVESAPVGASQPVDLAA